MASLTFETNSAIAQIGILGLTKVFLDIHTLKTLTFNTHVGGFRIKNDFYDE